MRTNGIVVLIVAACCAVCVFGEQLAQAASKVRIVGQDRGGSVACFGGQPIAQSSLCITNVKDLKRISETCGPMYEADFDCGGRVAVKGPKCASLERVKTSANKITFVFDNGDHVHAKKRDDQVTIDHDD